MTRIRQPQAKALLLCAEFLEQHASPKSLGARQSVAHWLRELAKLVPYYNKGVRVSKRKLPNSFYRVRRAGLDLPTYLKQTREEDLVNGWRWTTTYTHALKWKKKIIAEKWIDRLIAWHVERGDDPVKSAALYYVEEEGN